MALSVDGSDRTVIAMKKAQFGKAKEAVETHIKETAHASDGKESRRASGYAAFIHAPNAKKVKALINSLKGGLQVIEVTSPGIEEVLAALQSKEPELLVGVGDQFLAPTADVKNERWGALTSRAANLRKACETAAGLHERTGRKIKTQKGKQAVVKPKKVKEELAGEASVAAENGDRPSAKRRTEKKSDATSDEADSDEVPSKAAPKRGTKKTKGDVAKESELLQDDKKGIKTKERTAKDKAARDIKAPKKGDFNAASAAPSSAASAEESKKRVWKP